MKSFFNKKNKFHPPYFWASILLLSVSVAFVAKIVMSVLTYWQKQEIELSDTFILGVLGLVVAWMELYDVTRGK